MIRTLLGRTLYAIVATALVVGFPIGTHAQSSQGALRGTVEDSQGVIPGVTVTLVNEATNVSRETVTNTSGEYSFPAVEPATYVVKVAVQGFKSFGRWFSLRQTRRSQRAFWSDVWSGYLMRSTGCEGATASWGLTSLTSMR